VRGGGFIFCQPVVQDTGEMSGKPLRVLVAPAAESSSTLYEDDGKTMAYRRGFFMKRDFRQTNDGKSLHIEISSPEGSYRPAARDLILETRLDKEPQSVSIQVGDEKLGNQLPRLKSSNFAGATRGWMYSQGVLTVKDRDFFGKKCFIIQN
jgi:alpha-glucosidase